MTINKSQGQSIKERLGIYLPRAVFAHGQTYVALSRGGGFSSVRVVVEQEDGRQGRYEGADGVQDGTYTLNIVDRSLLTSAAENKDGLPNALPMLVEQELPQALGQEHPDEHDVCAGSSCPGCPPVLSPLDSCSGLLGTDRTMVPFSEDALPQESERISGSSGAEAASMLRLRSVRPRGPPWGAVPVVQAASLATPGCDVTRRLPSYEASRLRCNLGIYGEGPSNRSAQ